ncbi:probable RNA polymerase II nuclear localization protein SLC7A6OS [Centruroides sculpturatus]|uniref:probable RNA polymerase II nuclear localization protein SLC7A6OS n=1 Tax=Centruroides sculpturatus TaxID=218467 RepID=UPI000C6D2D9D|nr:probable RNA polymerase II nuclear localization protein SLC7A6OS [Centruroides sculpturatus]
MATLLRIKRKSSTEPTEAVVIASKRPRNETEVETVFKFIGTVKENEEQNGDHIEAFIKKHNTLKEKWGKSPKIRNSDFRAANRNYSDKRLKLLNSYRKIPDDIDKDVESKKIVNPTCSKSIQEPSNDLTNLYQCYDVYDEEEDSSTTERVEDRITCNGLPLLKSEEIEYVYDLYYSPDADFDSQAIENVVR